MTEKSTSQRNPTPVPQVTTERSKRIEMLRTIAILGVVVLHVPPLETDVAVRHSYSSEFLFQIKYLLSAAIFMASVPTLSVISGYLLFSTYNESRYLQTVIKKARTLVIPLILWNLPLLAILYAARIEGWPVYRDAGDLASLWDAVNLTVGITAPPLNFPLHFLLDIFICIVLSPVFSFFIRRAPFLGLAICVAILFADRENAVLVRGDIFASYYLGGLVAYKRWTLEAIDRYWWAFGGVFLALCIGYTAVEAAHGYAGGAFHDYGRQVLRIAGPFAFWGVSAYLAGVSWSDGVARFARYSFFIFCAHAPILKLLWMVYRAAGGTVESPLYWLFYGAAAPATVLLSVALLRLLMRVAPFVLDMLAVPPAPRYGAPGGERSVKEAG